MSDGESAMEGRRGRRFELRREIAGSRRPEWIIRMIVC